MASQLSLTFDTAVDFLNKELSNAKYDVKTKISIISSFKMFYPNEPNFQDKGITVQSIFSTLPFHHSIQLDYKFQPDEYIINYGTIGNVNSCIGYTMIFTNYGSYINESLHNNCSIIHYGEHKLSTLKLKILNKIINVFFSCRSYGDAQIVSRELKDAIK